MTLTGYAATSLGNLRTALRAGAIVEVASARRRTLHPDVATRPRALGWYGLLAVQPEVVVADALITGISSRQGATLRPFVGELQAGIGVRGRRVAVEYRNVLRSREYRAQPNAHAFGSFTVLWFH